MSVDKVLLSFSGLLEKSIEHSEDVCVFVCVSYTHTKRLAHLFCLTSSPEFLQCVCLEYFLLILTK